MDGNNDSKAYQGGTEVYADIETIAEVNDIRASLAHTDSGATRILVDFLTDTAEIDARRVASLKGYNGMQAYPVDVFKAAFEETYTQLVGESAARWLIAPVAPCAARFTIVA
jgi:hypothetical protein